MKEGKAELRRTCGEEHWWWPKPKPGQVCLCGQRVWTGPNVLNEDGTIGSSIPTKAMPEIPMEVLVMRSDGEQKVCTSAAEINEFLDA